MEKSIEISVKFQVDPRKTLTGIQTADRFTPAELNAITAVLGRIVQVVADYEQFGLGAPIKVMEHKEPEQIPEPVPHRGKARGGL